MVQTESTSTMDVFEGGFNLLLNGYNIETKLLNDNSVSHLSYLCNISQH